MHLVDAYPHDAVTGGCFLLGRYKLAPGERVMDLDVDAESLPTFGRLCISEDAIRSMCGALGWQLVTPEMAEREAAMSAELDAARAELAETREAVRGIADVRVVRKALEVISKRENPVAVG